jgi:hypothetical protein
MNLQPIEVKTYLNSDIPRSHGDQGVWQGKGLTQSISTGLLSTWWIFEAQISATGWVSRNMKSEDFPLDDLPNATRARIIARSSEIDMPARPFSSPSRALDWSGSYANVSIWHVSAGVSMENRWFGPGVRNSLMMGHQAPGFAHVFMKTERPIDLALGHLKGTYMAGKLEDTKVDLESRKGEWVYFSGVNASFSPRFIPGLELGLTRTFIINGSDLKTWSDYVPLLQPFDKSKLGAGTDGGGSQPDDQRASVYFSWSMNDDAVRVYGEFAKEDHNADIRDLIGEPEHNRAYQFGLEVRRNIKTGQIRSGFETTNLTMTNTQKTRSSGYWYTHTKVKQGYTHRGQLLGAAIGPGSSSQTIWSNLVASRATLGILLERVSVNRDLYDDIRQPGLKPEVDLTVGTHLVRKWDGIAVSAAYSLTHTSNRFYRQGVNRWLTSIQVGFRYEL